MGRGRHRQVRDGPDARYDGVRLYDLREDRTVTGWERVVADLLAIVLLVLVPLAVLSIAVYFGVLLASVYAEVRHRRFVRWLIGDRDEP